MTLGREITAAIAVVLMAGCATLRTGVVTDLDLARFRRIHISQACDTTVAAALRDGLTRRGIEVSSGSAEMMPETAELRVECECIVVRVPSIWSSTGQVSYLSRLFLVFLEAHGEAVVATGEFSGPARDLSAAAGQVEAILDELYPST